MLHLAVARKIHNHLVWDYYQTLYQTLATLRKNSIFLFYYISLVNITCDVMIFSWFSTKFSGNASYTGQVGTYPGNGYEVILGQYRADTEAIFDELYNNLWIDDKTRAIIIDFTVYNANINLFNQIR